MSSAVRCSVLVPFSLLGLLAASPGALAREAQAEATAAFTFHPIRDGIYLAEGTGRVAVGCMGR